MKVIRKNSQVEVWYGGEPNDCEADFVATFDYTLCPELIAALKRFEQREGR
jgi:hypothetical protein